MCWPARQPTIVGLESGSYFCVLAHAQLLSLQINSFACTSCSFDIFLTTQIWRHEQDWKKREKTLPTVSWAPGDTACGRITNISLSSKSSEYNLQFFSKTKLKVNCELV